VERNDINFMRGLFYVEHVCGWWNRYWNWCCKHLFCPQRLIFPFASSSIILRTSLSVPKIMILMPHPHNLMSNVGLSVWCIDCGQNDGILCQQPWNTIISNWSWFDIIQWHSNSIDIFNLLKLQTRCFVKFNSEHNCMLKSDWNNLKNNPFV
jgi:hypothetical protein